MDILSSLIKTYKIDCSKQLGIDFRALVNTHKIIEDDVKSDYGIQQKITKIIHFFNVDIEQQIKRKEPYQLKLKLIIEIIHLSIDDNILLHSFFIGGIIVASSLSASDIWRGVWDPEGTEAGDVAETGEEEGLEVGVVVGQHATQAVVRPGV